MRLPIRFSLSLFLSLFCLAAKADVPSTEIFVIRSVKILALTKEYLAISNIPNDQLRAACSFRFSGVRNSSSFTSETPQENLYLNLGTSYIPLSLQEGFPFEFSYTPKSADVGRIQISGRLMSTDPSQDPYLPKPATGKAPKQFHEVTSPYWVSSNWESAEYVVLQFTYNLKH